MTMTQEYFLRQEIGVLRRAFGSLNLSFRTEAVPDGLYEKPEYFMDAFNDTYYQRAWGYYEDGLHDYQQELFESILNVVLAEDAGRTWEELLCLGTSPAVVAVVFGDEDIEGYMEAFEEELKSLGECEGYDIARENRELLEECPDDFVYDVWDIHSQHFRQFSPFEQLANEINGFYEPEKLWSVYDDAICAGAEKYKSEVVE